MKRKKTQTLECHEKPIFPLLPLYVSFSVNFFISFFTKRKENGYKSKQIHTQTMISIVNGLLQNARHFYWNDIISRVYFFRISFENKINWFFSVVIYRGNNQFFFSFNELIEFASTFETFFTQNSSQNKPYSWCDTIEMKYVSGLRTFFRYFSQFFWVKKNGQKTTRRIKSTATLMMRKTHSTSHSIEKSVKCVTMYFPLRFFYQSNPENFS